MTQILAETLNSHFTEEFAHPSDQQIQSYYDQNIKKYKEVTLQRIILPANPGAADKDKPKPTEAERTAYAETIRAQWVAGGDPVKLQKDVMEHNGVTTTAPDINVGARRPGSLPEAHEGVFELKAAEISPVYSDQAAVLHLQGRLGPHSSPQRGEGHHLADLAAADVQGQNSADTECRHGHVERRLLRPRCSAARAAAT